MTDKHIYKAMGGLFGGTVTINENMSMHNCVCDNDGDCDNTADITIVHPDRYVMDAIIKMAKKHNRISIEINNNNSLLLRNVWHRLFLYMGAQKGLCIWMTETRSLTYIRVFWKAFWHNDQEKIVPKKVIDYLDKITIGTDFEYQIIEELDDNMVRIAL